MPYTPKPPHFHQLTQFVDIFTASGEKGREREERLIFREFLQMCPNSERLFEVVWGKGKEKEGESRLARR